MDGQYFSHFGKHTCKGVIIVFALAVTAGGQNTHSDFWHGWHGPAVQPYVSLHQLRAPAKAQKEVQRAADELQRGRTEQAKRHIESALAAYDNYSVALALRGMVEWGEYDDTHALADVQESIRVDPGCALAYLIKAEIYSGTGHYEDALAVLRGSSELLSWAWQYHYELCKALLGAKEYAASLSAINDALQIASPSNTTARDLASLHLFRAWVYAKLSEIGNARAEYDVAQKQDPKGDIGAAARHQLEHLH